jgi:DNA-binding transcriptional LysR family regulator
MNSTEAIISAVEAGLGIGFVPVMALDKAKLTDSVKIVPLENGPIKRQLSFALLSGPVREGPLQDLIGLLRLISPSAKRKIRRSAKAAGKPA